MSNVAEKARFYLERAVPQLREFEDKGIFSRHEIRSLVSKRSQFEHIVLAPGSKPADFLAYIQWERSLDALRAKRCRRLKIGSTTSHASHARTFGVFERAVTKHPGSRALWIAYLDFAAAARASKRWRRIMTRALRMHPRDAALWAVAGRRMAAAGDMSGARAFFLRGCRFCTEGHELWLAYARCEMEWLRRVEARKHGRGGGIDAVRTSEATGQEGHMIVFGDDSEDEHEDSDGVLMPDVEATPSPRDQPVLDEEARQRLETSPALSGALPITIWDVAKKQPFFGPIAAEAFFDMFADFHGVSVQARLLQHVLDSMEEAFPTHAATCSCRVRQPLIGLDPDTPAFPRALRESLVRLRRALDTADGAGKKGLVERTLGWIGPILALDHLDVGIRTVLERTVESFQDAR